MIRSLQYAFIAIIVTTVGFSLYQWNASRASTQKTAPNNGLVGYWKLDEGTGTTTLDASGNNYTGTLTSGPTWVNGGKVNKSVSFDGTNDYITMGDQSLLEINNNSFSFGGWFYINAYPAVNNRMFLITKGNGGGFEYELTVNGYSTNHLVATLFQPGGSNYIFVSSNTVPPLNTWFHVMGVWDKDAVAMRVYYNGVLENTSTTTSGSLHTTRTAPFEIGRRNDNAEQTLNGLADEVRVYNRALSATEVMTVYNLNATRLNTSENSSLTSGLVGLWSFNGADLSGTTAYDRSSNTNNGTLTNGPTTTIGKVGQALNFDGSNDYVNIPDHSSFDFNYNQDFSISSWVNAPSTQIDLTSSYNHIIGKWSGNGGGGNGYPYILRLMNQTNASPGVICMYRYDGSNAPGVCSTVRINDNAWHSVTGTKLGSTLSLYVDGVLQSTATDTTTTTTTNALALRIGETGNGSRYFQGQIDDVRIYNRALSAGEVQSLYDLGASDKVNSSVSQNQGTGRLDSGLVGYWKLDDASGTTATDSSINANNGTLTGGPTWGTGKINGATDFTGSTYITIPNSTPLQVTGSMTASFWLYMRSWSNGNWSPIINKFSSDGSNEFNIRTQISSQGQFYNGTGGGLITWDPAADVGLNAWVHVVARRDVNTGVMDMWFNGVKKRSGAAGSAVSSTTQPLQLGAGPNGGTVGRVFDGLLDEVRVYNRAISDDEIAQLYRLNRPSGTDTGLKGYWSFNGSDISGTTAYDRSGAGNTGTLTNGPTKTIGKLGQALNFDGTDDYVSVAGTQSVQNVSYWVKPSASTYSKYSIGLSGLKRYFLNNGLYSGTNTATRYINAATPSSESLGSEILNGTFESGNLSGWSTYFQGGAGGGASVISSAPYAGTYSVDFNAYGGSALWHAVLYDTTPRSVTAGTLYKFQFAAKGSSAKNGLSAFLQQGGSPWRGILPTYTFDVTTSWVLHTFYFYADFTDSNIQSYFGVGGLGGFDLYLDNISLKPVTSVGDVTTGAWNFVSVNLDSPVTADNIIMGLGSGLQNGSLDEVRIYNRALSAGEITTLYNSGR